MASYKYRSTRLVTNTTDATGDSLTEPSVGSVLEAVLFIQGTTSITGSLQIDRAAGTTHSVLIQGRADQDAPWADIGAAITAEGITTFSLMPEMRVTWSANDGTMSIWMVE